MSVAEEEEEEEEEEKKESTVEDGKGMERKKEQRGRRIRGGRGQSSGK